MTVELYEMKNDGTLNPTLEAYSEDGQMTAYIIADIGSSESTAGMRKCYNSILNTDSKLSVFVLPATIPKTLNETMLLFDLSVADWKYPIKPGEKKIDFVSGLHLTGYNAKDIRKVISCLFSHMRVWMKIMKSGKPGIVLEHDAVFIRSFTMTQKQVMDTGFDFIGLNDPRGATRKANVFLERVLSQTKEGKEIYDCPWVDDDRLAPQGLAGHSAYIITPNGAKRMFEKIKEVGLWPNDALMCKQFFPDLKVTYPFYTRVQGIKSTTQG
jgi:hypothetical protein